MVDGSGQDLGRVLATSVLEGMAIPMSLTHSGTWSVGIW